MINTRPAAVAGSFYSGDAIELSNTVDGLLANTHSHLTQPARAYIVPHAGYIYSGQVAAEAYSQMAKQATNIQRVVLFGPCHRVWIKGLAIPSVDKFETPLGTISLDTEQLQKIATFPQVQYSNEAHQQEHSLEVQLPFIQRCLKPVLSEVKLIPIVVGEASTEDVSQIIDYFFSDQNTVIIVSSDLSHFHDYETAKQIDKQTTGLIENFDFHSLSHEMACGSTSIQGLLKVAKQKSMQIKTLAQCNSGDTAGDKNSVVGYACYAFF